MWDFSKLLGSLAGEDSKGFLGGVIDPNARKRTPPKTELTPSENAAGELMTGIHEAAQAPTKPAISPLRQGLASGLKSVGQALGGMHSAEFMPVAPVQIYDQPIIQPYQSPQIPRFARGGKLKKGLNVVGEEGPEIAVHDGKDTKIVPLSQNDAEDPTYWDAQVAMQKAGQATPPFVSTPGYEAAKRRAFDAETGNQPITTDASVSSNVTNRPMDYVPVSPSDVQQGRVGTQPVVVQPQYSTPPTAQQEMPIAQAPAPTSNPGATQSSGNPLEDLRQQKIDLNAQPIQKQSFWKDFGTNLILGANAFFNPQNGPSPMVGWGAVKRQNENNALDRQIKPLEAIKAQQDKEAYDKARTENIYADNSTAQQRILDAKEARAERQKGMAIGRLAKMQYFDPKNAIHAQLAKEAGLNPDELEGFDWRSPHTKTVAGTTYQWSNGKFVPSDIPPDESASLVDYSVQMPDGEVQSFKVPQKDAARFATQMHVLGAQIQAADRRQDKSIAAQRETQGRIDARQAVQQKFQAQLQADRQKNGAEAADARARIALKKAGITDDEIERWLHPEKYPTLDPNDYNLNPDGFVLESKP